MNKKKLNTNKQNSMKTEEYAIKKGISRRSFLKSLKGASVLTAGSVMGNAGVFSPDTPAKQEKKKNIGPDAVIIKLHINGSQRNITVRPHETLADILRNHLELTGTKVVCNRGACSACTILLDGKPVNSCMILVLDAVGKEIHTIESLAENGKLNPLQQAFIDHDASQCGFCTPGMLMSCTHLLQNKTYPAIEDIKQAISGNLCRCGTHLHVLKAVLKVVETYKTKGIQNEYAKN
jgi:aerobic-type carbon monoxide dehydrogenase small subunit (CoxS/CutS family)